MRRTLGKHPDHMSVVWVEHTQQMEYSAGAEAALARLQPVGPKDRRLGLLLPRGALPKGTTKAQRELLRASALAAIARVHEARAPDVELREINDPHHHVHAAKPQGATTLGVFARWVHAPVSGLNG